MNQINLCQEIVDGLGSLFVCTPHGDYQRVRTPYLYPDGDNIDIFCKQENDVVFVSDLGETTRWLKAQTISSKRTPKQKSLIEDVCLTHGVEFYKGILLAKCHQKESLTAVVTRVAQAALRVSDLWFTFKMRHVENVNDEVADFLTERQFDFARRVKLAGRSGRGWTVDFQVHSAKRNSLVYVLSTGSRSAAKSVTEHVLAAWVDLNQLKVGPDALQFISLFDDTMDVWSESDFKLLEPFSEVQQWSHSDDLADVLADVA